MKTRILRLRKYPNNYDESSIGPDNKLKNRHSPNWENLTKVMSYVYVAY